MKIGLDFGGVIANHLPIKMQLAQEMFGITVDSFSDATRAHLLPVMGEEKYERLAAAVGLRVADFPLMPGAQEALGSLAAAGHTLHIISTQNTATQDMLQMYVAAHALPIESITVVQADTGKLAGCRKTGVELFLDDSLSVLTSLQLLQVPLFLADFSENESSDAPEWFTCIRTWEEFPSRVEEIVLEKYEA